MDFGYAIIDVTAGVEVAEPHDAPGGQTVFYVGDHVGTLVGIASPIGA